MPSPFPGMNPYLENPVLWSEVHNRLIVALADQIAPPLRPEYYVAIERRTYLAEPEDSVLVGVADVAIFSKQAAAVQNRTVATAVLSASEPLTVTLPLPEEVNESYLEIRDVKTGAVISMIEVLSPKNKRTGEGREAYLRKRTQILASFTHLIEIDLLRGGESMPLQGVKPDADYRILVSRGNRRPTAHLYAFNLPDPIPVFPLPLKPGELEPAVDLKPLLEGVYDRAGFDLRVDYAELAQPPLTAENAIWAAELLQECFKD